MKINTTSKELLIFITYCISFGLLYLFSGTGITTSDYILFILGSFLCLVLLIGDELIFFKYYTEDGEQKNLVTRSTIFLIMYIPLSLFVITSAGSLIGTGLVLTLGACLFVEMWDTRKSSEQFYQRFLHQLKKLYSLYDIQRGIIAFGIFVLLLHILALR